MVMQSADERMGADAADPLNWARDRRIFAQRSVRSGLIIVGGVFAQDPAQVHFAQDDKASRAAEFHHRALTEPYVSLSTHTAPSIRPFAYRRRQWGKSHGVRLTTPANHVRARFGRRRRRLNLR